MPFSNTYLLDEPSVPQLWDELRSGDKSALEAIYKLFIKDLYKFGMSLHADDAIVKDAIQDIFIDLWQYRARLCGDAAVKQYLFKALSNRIQKELGKDARRSKLNWLTDEDKSAVISVEDEIVLRQTETEITGKMKQAMTLLPLRQKEVIHYLFFEKLSYEETATLLGINIRSTYTLAWKAISALKKAITILVFILVTG
ncbi:RNA polymerase sigma factor (sigma-70 family) [Algoriphagus sp. 4150]|uniref:RNA polymerase sigma factor n=1 Tax=Algoriphagus sp. 4150 TaxID=2817756 RepID=UPI0028623339|nr:sigma-70 family RNA polymerase sigma factor [Algoriphagus sp. 4150]MDR7132377.1 RNA polymerase sigma factor (sigma-70 family) [Algoriphagus sp. 4150]